MDIIDSIGQDVISRLSSRYPEIKFELVDIHRNNSELVLEYNSSVGYHEQIGMHVDFLGLVILKNMSKLSLLYLTIFVSCLMQKMTTVTGMTDTPGSFQSIGI